MHWCKRSHQTRMYCLWAVLQCSSWAISQRLCQPSGAFVRRERIPAIECLDIRALHVNIHTCTHNTYIDLIYLNFRKFYTSNTYIHYVHTWYTYTCMYVHTHVSLNTCACMHTYNYISACRRLDIGIHNVSCRTFEYAMSHFWVRHSSVMPHKRMRHATHTNYACRTHEWVTTLTRDISWTWGYRMLDPQIPYSPFACTDKPHVHYCGAPCGTKVFPTKKVSVSSEEPVYPQKKCINIADGPTYLQ